MKVKPVQLKNLFLRSNLLTAEQFDSAEKEAKAKDIPLEEYLVQNGFITDNHLGQLLANHFKLNFVDLSQEKIAEQTFALIPEIVAEAHRAVAFRQDGQKLYVATSNPEDYEFFKLLERKTGREVLTYYATPLAIAETLKHYKGNLAMEVERLISDLKANPGNDENIVKLVDLFLEYAHDNRASDIHLEPLKNKVSARFRIDGVLHEVVNYPKSLHERIVFRVKIMARLRTDEHAAAQDGRFDYRLDEATFDVRVSVMPVTGGENVVMRLLAERTQRFDLEKLGLLESDLDKVRRAAGKPYGMILAAGPTGSGKTTTLYAILYVLNKPEINIMTIEDPVEYDVERVQQTQVNPKKNLTFATGLRSIVRQDPDVIMVGEIRDAETADIAVNAAMTGHLLLSTLHANNAATVFPRLMEMEIEPFLVASSVNVIIAQRLIRKICERCRMTYFLSHEELQVIQSDPLLERYIREISGRQDFSKIRFYRGAKCEVCSHTGYSGRTGIFEVLEVTDEIRSLITQKAPADVIDQKAKELGMTPMAADGITKAFQGITTLEEVMRTTKG